MVKGLEIVYAMQMARSAPGSPQRLSLSDKAQSFAQIVDDIDDNTRSVQLDEGEEAQDPFVFVVVGSGEVTPTE